MCRPVSICSVSISLQTPSHLYVCPFTGEHDSLSYQIEHRHRHPLPSVCARPSPSTTVDNGNHFFLIESSIHSTPTAFKPFITNHARPPTHQTISPKKAQLMVDNPSAAAASHQQCKQAVALPFHSRHEQPPSPSCWRHALPCPS